MPEQPITKDEEQNVRDIFAFFYPSNPPGCINRELSTLAANMLCQAVEASKLFDLVPRPGGVPSFAWLMQQAVMAGWRRATNENRIYETVRVRVAQANRGAYEVEKTGCG